MMSSAGEVDAGTELALPRAEAPSRLGGVGDLVEVALRIEAARDRDDVIAVIAALGCSQSSRAPLTVE